MGMLRALLAACLLAAAAATGDDILVSFPVQEGSGAGEAAPAHDDILVSFPAPEASGVAAALAPLRAGLDTSFGVAGIIDALRGEACVEAQLFLDSTLPLQRQRRDSSCQRLEAAAVGQQAFAEAAAAVKSVTDAGVLAGVRIAEVRLFAAPRGSQVFLSRALERASWFLTLSRGDALYLDDSSIQSGNAFVGDGEEAIVLRSYDKAAKRFLVVELEKHAPAVELFGELASTRCDGGFASASFLDDPSVAYGIRALEGNALSRVQVADDGGWVLDVRLPFRNCTGLSLYWEEPSSLRQETYEICSRVVDGDAVEEVRACARLLAKRARFFQARALYSIEFRGGGKHDQLSFMETSPQDLYVLKSIVGAGITTNTWAGYDTVKSCIFEYTTLGGSRFVYDAGADGPGCLLGSQWALAKGYRDLHQVCEGHAADTVALNLLKQLGYDGACECPEGTVISVSLGGQVQRWVCAGDDTLSMRAMGDDVPSAGEVRDVSPACFLQLYWKAELTIVKTVTLAESTAFLAPIRLDRASTAAEALALYQWLLDVHGTQAREIGADAVPKARALPLPGYLPAAILRDGRSAAAEAAINAFTANEPYPMRTVHVILRYCMLDGGSALERTTGVELLQAHIAGSTSTAAERISAFLKAFASMDLLAVLGDRVAFHRALEAAGTRETLGLQDGDGVSYDFFTGGHVLPLECDAFLKEPPEAQWSYMSRFASSGFPESEKAPQMCAHRRQLPAEYTFLATRRVSRPLPGGRLRLLAFVESWPGTLDFSPLVIHVHNRPLAEEVVPVGYWPGVWQQAKNVVKASALAVMQAHHCRDADYSFFTLDMIVDESMRVWLADASVAPDYSDDSSVDAKALHEDVVALMTHLASAADRGDDAVRASNFETI
mmetsp:Transcript_3185/g.9111  ORF Transcript_3185/g.9111 Transcript_3185/m.9111 type:complete len:892 (-) Transcript_3185:2513-5188(-)|eukprot:CAMPEP_0118865512 /NCGR_PEP_ID=MMETSP1163-20130328/9747_1 /TAXON_ID=124430 /ORGANISM="Phaeomonas parva, Strain CCMP2877" /LENGTH=891 /DNA_ID=CAMNT_0006799745 /DNA_START=193 /DNA_END=2868 /DNA_ORIENTATION=-